MKRVVLVWPPVAASTGRHFWQELYCLFLQFQSHEAFPEKRLATALRNMKLSSMYPQIQEALIPSALVVVNQRSKTLGLLSLLDCHVEAFSEELDLHKQGRSLSLYQEDLEGEIGVTQVAPEETQVDFRPIFFSQFLFPSILYCVRRRREAFCSRVTLVLGMVLVYPVLRTITWKRSWKFPYHTVIWCPISTCPQRCCGRPQVRPNLVPFPLLQHV